MRLPGAHFSNELQLPTGGSTGEMLKYSPQHDIVHDTAAGLSLHAHIIVALYLLEIKLQINEYVLSGSALLVKLCPGQPNGRLWDFLSP